MESKTNYIERYWRDATPQDAIKEPPMKARFRDDGDEYTGPSEYEPSVLTGVDRTEAGDVIRWFSNFGALSFNHCQVYDAPEPKYVPFTWEDREQLRGRLITFVDRNRTVEFRCESFAVDDDGLIVNDAYADWLCKNAVFVDTKEPVGKRVQ